MERYCLLIILSRDLIRKLLTKIFHNIKEECALLELEMSHIIKNRRYKKQWIYLGVILFVIICILIYIKVQMFIEERNHENWVNQKEQEFKPVIELVYGVMRGEKKFQKQVQYLSMIYHIMEVIKKLIELKRILK